MKTQNEIEKMLKDLEDKMQEVNSKLEKVSSMEEALPHHDRRRQLQAQYNILLEVLK